MSRPRRSRTVGGAIRKPATRFPVETRTLPSQASSCGSRVPVSSFQRRARFGRWLPRRSRTARRPRRRRRRSRFRTASIEPRPARGGAGAACRIRGGHPQRLPGAGVELVARARELDSHAPGGAAVRCSREGRSECSPEEGGGCVCLVAGVASGGGGKHTAAASAANTTSGSNVACPGVRRALRRPQFFVDRHVSSTRSLCARKEMIARTGYIGPRAALLEGKRHSQAAKRPKFTLPRARRIVGYRAAVRGRLP